MDTQQNTSCLCVPIKLFVSERFDSRECLQFSVSSNTDQNLKRSSVFYVSSCMAETRMIQKRARVISLINVWIPGWQNSAAQLVPCLSMDCRSWNSLFMCPCVTCVHVTFITVVYGPLFCWFVRRFWNLKNPSYIRLECIGEAAAAADNPLGTNRTNLLWLFSCMFASNFV